MTAAATTPNTRRMGTNDKKSRRRWFGGKRSKEPSLLDDFAERMERGEVSDEERKSVMDALEEMRRKLEG